MATTPPRGSLHSPLFCKKEREMKQSIAQHCVAHCSGLAPQELQGSSDSYIRTPKWGRTTQPHLNPKHYIPMYALGDYSPVECFPREMPHLSPMLIKGETNKTWGVLSAPAPSSCSFLKGRHIHYISRRLEMKAGHIVVCAKLTLPRLPMRMPQGFS